jgi:transposase InsO family protein
VNKEILCGLFGISRQAHHQNSKIEFTQRAENEIILDFVRNLRERQGKVGARKIQLHIQEELTPKSGIEIGRDALFDLLREHGLLVRRRKKRPQTTDSNHHYRKYPNIIRGLIPSGANQLLVSDLTYIDTDEGFVYLFLITDAYSRKIVGYYIGMTMEALGAIQALNQSIKQLPAESKPIHHSDRGVQYACNEYTKILTNQEMPISMTENGNPLENCMAERTNGLVKELIDNTFKTKLEAILTMPTIINIYNTERKHGSIGMLTPEQAHTSDQPLKNYWKKKPAIASV